MTNRTIWLVALIWFAMVFFVFPKLFPTTPPPEAEVLLEQGQKLEREAGDDPKKLNGAIKVYQSLAKIKQYKKTEYAAEARLRIGIIQEEKLNQGHRAAKTYQSLIKAFSPEKWDAARQAQGRIHELEVTIDRRNSSHTLYKIMDALVGATGRNPRYSYAIALLVITLVFKFLTTPLSRLQFKYMKEMQRIQPLVKQLQEKYKNNQQDMGKKLMELYKKEGVNPFSSCLPILVQLPVLYLLYWMVRLYEFQFQKGTLLWIGSSLAAKYPAIVGSNLAERDIPLLVIYTISMIISQRISIVDPSQAQQQKIMAYTMPLLFAYIFLSFPSAFMLYWLLFNVVSTTQQYLILKRPAKPGEPGGGPGGAERQALAPVEAPKPAKKPKVSPGKARKRRKRRRFDAPKRPRSAIELIPTG